MKFLHTADWHIGKKLHGYDLLEDQAHILKQILRIAKEEQVDAIVVAGDLYDRSVPSEASVRLLNQTLAEMNLTEKFPLLVIAGNHDSAARLATGTPWFGPSSFHLHTQLAQAFQPVVIGDTAFYLLPYFEPVDARMYFADPAIQTIQEAFPFVIAEMEKSFDPQKKHVLVSHFFVAGSSKTDSETKIEVGGLSGITGGLLKNFDYVALGHLHGKDALHLPNARYSGSPLKYSLSEKNQEKGVFIVEMDKAVSLTFHPLEPLREVREYEASFAELLDPVYYRSLDREAYLSILLKDRTVIPNMMNQLREVYPRIIQIERSQGRTMEARELKQAEKVKKQSPVELTATFFQEMTDHELTAQQKHWVEEGLKGALEKGEPL